MDDHRRLADALEHMAPARRDAERPWSPEMAHVDQPITHRADCLLALVTEETRAPSPEHEATAAILNDHHDTRMPG